MLETLRNEGSIPKDIGWDLSTAAIWRPKATQNIVFRLSGAVLVPGNGLSRPVRQQRPGPGILLDPRQRDPELLMRGAAILLDLMRSMSRRMAGLVVPAIAMLLLPAAILCASDEEKPVSARSMSPRRPRR